MTHHYGAQVSQSALVNCEPLEIAAHHWPVLLTRPTMSADRSLLRSAAFTSTHVTPVDQVAHLAVANAEPVEIPEVEVEMARRRRTDRGRSLP